VNPVVAQIVRVMYHSSVHQHELTHLVAGSEAAEKWFKTSRPNIPLDGTFSSKTKMQGISHISIISLQYNLACSMLHNVPSSYHCRHLKIFLSKKCSKKTYDYVQFSHHFDPKN